MSFSFEGLPRTLDTVLFKRVSCGETEFSFNGEPVAIHPSPSMGWVIVLPRAATPAEKKWLAENDFVFHRRRGQGGGGRWRRFDRPDDFVQHRTSKGA